MQPNLHRPAGVRLASPLFTSCQDPGLQAWPPLQGLLQPRKEAASQSVGKSPAQEVSTEDGCVSQAPLKAPTGALQDAQATAHTQQMSVVVLLAVLYHRDDHMEPLLSPLVASQSRGHLSTSDD